MKRQIFTAIAVSALLISFSATVCSHAVSADTEDFISYLDSGVTVYSPLNITYHAQTPILKVNLYGAGNFGSLDPEISMNYSIDDVNYGSVYLRSNGEMHFITNAIGTADLPELPSGSHCLKIFLYGWNQRSYEPRYVSYVNAVYFSIVDSTVTPSPLPNPTPTRALAPTPALTLNPELTSEPESFPATQVLVAFAATAVVALVLLVQFNRRRRNSRH